MPAFNPAMVSESILSLASFAYQISQVAAPPEPLPAPVASSSGPKRTKKTVREGRRFDPLKPAGRTERVGLKKVGWDRTLSRFRTQLHNGLHSVHQGQPSGGFVPATALAEIDKIVKEDLEQSVSRFLYCVLVHRFTNFVNLATAAPGYGSRERNSLQGCGGLP